VFVVLNCEELHVSRNGLTCLPGNNVIVFVVLNCDDDVKGVDVGYCLFVCCCCLLLYS